MTDETTTVEDREADAAFGAGFDAKPTAKVEEKPEPAPEKTQAKEDPQPEHVQITKAEWEEIKAAVAKVPSFDKQFSTAFGTIGKVKQTLDAMKAEAEGKRVELSNAAFTKLKDQFPELAEMTKEAVQNALNEAPRHSAPATDDTEIERKLEERVNKREKVFLEEDHPDWQAIVGAPPAEGQPPVETPFRKWLAGKDETYQERIKNTFSPAELSRAIDRFKRETRQQAKNQPSPRADARREALAAAVQPRGDGAPPSNTDTLEAAFAAGFNS